MKVADLTSDRDGTASNNTTNTVSWPAGVAAGDVVDIGFLTNTTSATVTSLTAGANDWVALGAIQHGGLVIQSANTGLLHVVRKLDAVDVAAGGVTLTWSASGRIAGGGSAYRGVGTFRVSTPTQAAAATVAAAVMAQTATRSDFGLIAVARVASGTIAVLTGGTGFPTDVNHSTNFSTAGVNMTLATAHSGSPPGSGQNVGGQTVSATAGTVAQIIVALTEFDAVPVGPPLQTYGTRRTKWNRSQSLVQAAPTAGPTYTPADGYGAASASASGTATVTSGAAGSGSARADDAGAATAQTGAAGAGAASGQGSAAATSQTSAAGAAQSLAGASGAVTVSTPGTGSGSARSNAAGQVSVSVVASSTSTGTSTAAGAGLVSSPSTGSAAGRADAAGAATATSGQQGAGSASALSTASGAATVTTAGLGSGSGKAAAAGIFSATTVAAVGSAAASAGVSAGAGARVNTTAAGLARAAGQAYGLPVILVRAAATAQALSGAAGASTTQPPRDIRPDVQMLDNRWGVKGPADRYDVALIDRWQTKLLEDG